MSRITKILYLFSFTSAWQCFYGAVLLPLGDNASYAGIRYGRIVLAAQDTPNVTRSHPLFMQCNNALLYESRNFRHVVYMSVYFFPCIFQLYM